MSRGSVRRRLSARALSRPRSLAVAIVVVAALLVGATYLFLSAPLVRDGFEGSDSLVTNEWATTNPSSPEAVLSPVWLVTSGSLFRRDGRGWSGTPDTLPPGSSSKTATNSAVFRMVTRRDDIMDAVVKVRFKVDRFGPAQESGWSGLHVFARYHNPNELLVVSVCRHDGLVVVKKKVAQDGQGVYYVLGQVARPCQVSGWHTAELDVRNVKGAVQVSVRIDSKDVLTVRDSGQGGPALTRPGRVGFRGDNVPFELDDLLVAKPD